MAKRLRRDPGAPKRNLSAYLLYQNAMREQFKALNPGMTFGQLAKYTSAMYAELTPSEKEAWAARAEADKARYLHELASYVPPPGYDSKGDAIISPLTAKTGRRGKPEKDVNAPKRNMSAYLLYQNGMREQFKRENPGMTFGQLAKYTSHMYKNLTVEEKATWMARSEQDKSRYDAELSAYVPPPGHDARGVLIEDNRPKRKNKRGPKDPAAPKRPSGAYVCFTNDMRPKVLTEYPGIKFVDLGKVLGERWRALTPDQKKQYEQLAAEDKVRFQMEMQQYTANQQAQAPPPAPVVQQHMMVPPPVLSEHAHHQYYADPNAAYAAQYAHDPYAQHAQYHAA
jgi:high mobility group protein B2